eukprot:gene24160-9747_t
MAEGCRLCPMTQACMQQLALACHCLAFLSCKLNHLDQIHHQQHELSPLMLEQPLAQPPMPMSPAHQSSSPRGPRGSSFSPSLLHSPRCQVTGAAVLLPQGAQVQAPGGLAFPQGVQSRNFNVRRVKNMLTHWVETEANLNNIVGLPVAIVWQPQGLQQQLHKHSQSLSQPNVRDPKALSSPCYGGHLAHAETVPEGRELGYSGHLPHADKAHAHGGHTSDEDEHTGLGACTPSFSAMLSAYHNCHLHLIHASYNVQNLLHNVPRQQPLLRINTMSSHVIARTPAAVLEYGSRGAIGPDKDPNPVPRWFQDPAFASGLLLLAHACEEPLNQLASSGLAAPVQESPQQQQQQEGAVSTRPCGPALAGTRVNWPLLRRYPSAARAAALWHEHGDWRKAAVLCLAVHQRHQEKQQQRLALIQASQPMEGGGVAQVLEGGDDLQVFERLHAFGSQVLEGGGVVQLMEGGGSVQVLKGGGGQQVFERMQAFGSQLLEGGGSLQQVMEGGDSVDQLGLGEADSAAHQNGSPETGEADSTAHQNAHQNGVHTNPGDARACDAAKSRDGEKVNNISSADQNGVHATSDGARAFDAAESNSGEQVISISAQKHIEFHATSDGDQACDAADGRNAELNSLSAANLSRTRASSDHPDACVAAESRNGEEVNDESHIGESDAAESRNGEGVINKPHVGVSDAAAENRNGLDAIISNDDSGSECLRVGISILENQMTLCRHMEVQEACDTLHELVAIPRHVLGVHSQVYISILSQVYISTLGQMEAYEACHTLHELVAIPRHVLGVHSQVYISIPGQVSHKLCDMVPKRLGITPLLPELSSSPSLLLNFCHLDIRLQLQSQLALCLSRVYGELRLAHGCSRTPNKPANEVVHALLTEPEVEARLKLLLRWQGTYSWEKLDEAIQKTIAHFAHGSLSKESDWEATRFIESLKGAALHAPLDSKPQHSKHYRVSCLQTIAHFAHSTLSKESDWEATRFIESLKGVTIAHFAHGSLSEESDWEAKRFIESLEGAALNASLLPPGDLAPVLRQALGLLDKQQEQQQQAQQQADASDALEGKLSHALSGMPAPSQLSDLNDIALIVDVSQICGTLLMTLKPHIVPALEELSTPGALDRVGWEDEEEEREKAKEAKGTAALPSGIAASAIRQMMRMDWALVCRTRVAALLKQLWQLEEDVKPKRCPSTRRLLSFNGAKALFVGSSSFQPMDEFGGQLSARRSDLLESGPLRRTLGVAKHSTSMSGSIECPMGPLPVHHQSVSVQLMQWSAAMALADTFHADTELQAVLHTILQQALRKRHLYNGKLAEQIKRLKVSAASLNESTIQEASVSRQGKADGDLSAGSGKVARISSPAFVPMPQPPKSEGDLGAGSSVGARVSSPAFIPMPQPLKVEGVLGAGSGASARVNSPSLLSSRPSPLIHKSTSQSQPQNLSLIDLLKGGGGLGSLSSGPMRVGPGSGVGGLTRPEEVRKRLITSTLDLLRLFASDSHSHAGAQGVGPSHLGSDACPPPHSSASAVLSTGQAGAQGAGPSHLGSDSCPPARSSSSAMQSSRWSSSYKSSLSSAGSLAFDPTTPQFRHSSVLCCLLAALASNPHQHLACGPMATNLGKYHNLRQCFRQQADSLDKQRQQPQQRQHVQVGPSPLIKPSLPHGSDQGDSRDSSSGLMPAYDTASPSAVQHTCWTVSELATEYPSTDKTTSLEEFMTVAASNDSENSLDKCMLASSTPNRLTNTSGEGHAPCLLSRLAGNAPRVGWGTSPGSDGGPASNGGPGSYGGPGSHGVPGSNGGPGPQGGLGSHGGPWEGSTAAQASRESVNPCSVSPLLDQFFAIPKGQEQAAGAASDRTRSSSMVGQASLGGMGGMGEKDDTGVAALVTADCGGRVVSTGGANGWAAAAHSCVDGSSAHHSASSGDAKLAGAADSQASSHAKLAGNGDSKTSSHAKLAGGSIEKKGTPGRLGTGRSSSENHSTSQRPHFSNSSRVNKSSSQKEPAAGTSATRATASLATHTSAPGERVHLAGSSSHIPHVTPSNGNTSNGNSNGNSQHNTSNGTQSLLPRCSSDRYTKLRVKINSDESPLPIAEFFREPGQIEVGQHGANGPAVGRHDSNGIAVGRQGASGIALPASTAEANGLPPRAKRPSSSSGSSRVPERSHSSHQNSHSSHHHRHSSHQDRHSSAAAAPKPTSSASSSHAATAPKPTNDASRQMPHMPLPQPSRSHSAMPHTHAAKSFHSAQSKPMPRQSSNRSSSHCQVPPSGPPLYTPYTQSRSSHTGDSTYYHGQVPPSGPPLRTPSTQSRSSHTGECTSNHGQGPPSAPPLCTPSTRSRGSHTGECTSNHGQGPPSGPPLRTPSTRSRDSYTGERTSSRGKAPPSFRQSALDQPFEPGPYAASYSSSHGSVSIPFPHRWPEPPSGSTVHLPSSGQAFEVMLNSSRDGSHSSMLAPPVGYSSGSVNFPFSTEMSHAEDGTSALGQYPDRAHLPPHQHQLPAVDDVVEEMQLLASQWQAPNGDVSQCETRDGDGEGEGERPILLSSFLREVESDAPRIANLSTISTEFPFSGSEANQLNPLFDLPRPLSTTATDHESIWRIP